MKQTDYMAAAPHSAAVEVSGSSKVSSCDLISGSSMQDSFL